MVTHKPPFLTYTPTSKRRARSLRRDSTTAEQRLWHFLRRNAFGAHFRRQSPIGPYFADFYSNAARIVVEVDGGQHCTAEGTRKDQNRDRHLAGQGLLVLRFGNEDVLKNVEAVVEEIGRAVEERLRKNAEAAR